MNKHVKAVFDEKKKSWSFIALEPIEKGDTIAFPINEPEDLGTPSQQRLEQKKGGPENFLEITPIDVRFTKDDVFVKLRIASCFTLVKHKSHFFSCDLQDTVRYSEGDQEIKVGEKFRRDAKRKDI